jgi:peptidyl-prolyl cis-trans isomerase C
MKIKQLFLALAAISTLSFTSALYAADAAATVNGKPIKQSWVDFILKDAQAHGQKPSEGMKNAAINELIGSELVYQEAVKLGLDKVPDYQTNLELTQRKLLVDTYIIDFIKKNPVSDTEAKAAYDQFKKEMGDKEYNARHILVKTEAEAKDIQAQLTKGGDFAKLAKEKSLDTSNKDKGGDLGWFSPARMVKPFSDALISLKKGDVSSAPVQTQYGWHVIKLVDTRATPFATYEKAKPEVESKLQQIKVQKMLIGLKDKSKIDVPGVTSAK